MVGICGYMTCTCGMIRDPDVKLINEYKISKDEASKFSQMLIQKSLSTAECLLSFVKFSMCALSSHLNCHISLRCTQYS